MKLEPMTDDAIEERFARYASEAGMLEHSDWVTVANLILAARDAQWQAAIAEQPVVAQSRYGEIVGAWNRMYQRMNIYSVPGTLVVFDGCGGYDGEKKHAEKVLTLRHAYEVDRVNVGSSSSSVRLKGIDGWFNTCMFAESPLYAHPPREAEPAPQGVQPSRVGTIGHIDSGKSTLTAAIAPLLTEASKPVQAEAPSSALIEAVDTLLDTAPCDCSDKRRFEKGEHLSHCYLFDLNVSRLATQQAEATTASNTEREGWRAVPLKMTGSMRAACRLERAKLPISSSDELWEALLNAAPQPTASNAEREALPPLDDPISEAMSRYLKVCRSGGLSAKKSREIQAHVENAERLNYFKLIVAHWIADSRAALATQQEAQPQAEPLTVEQIEGLEVWKQFVGLWPDKRIEIVRTVEVAHGIAARAAQQATGERG